MPSTLRWKQLRTVPYSSSYTVPRPHFLRARRYVDKNGVYSEWYTILFDAGNMETASREGLQGPDAAEADKQVSNARQAHCPVAGHVVPAARKVVDLTDSFPRLSRSQALIKHSWPCTFRLRIRESSHTASGRKDPGLNPSSLISSQTVKSSASMMEEEVEDAERNARENLNRQRVLERKQLALRKEVDALRRRSRSETGGSDAVKEKNVRLAEIAAEEERLMMRIKEKEAQLQSVLDEEAAQRAIVHQKDETLSNIQSRLEAAKAQKALLTDATAALNAELTVQKDKLRELASDKVSVPRLEAALEAVRVEHQELLNVQQRTLQEDKHVMQSAANEQLRQARDAFAERQRDLAAQIDEARKRLSLLMDGTATQEESLRKQIHLLRHKVEQLDLQHEQISIAIPAASRPLIRQLQELEQVSHRREWEFREAERARKEQDRHLELQIQQSKENERSLLEQLRELSSITEQLESAIVKLDRTNAALHDELGRHQAEALLSKRDHERQLESARSALARKREALLSKRQALAELLEANEQEVGELSARVQALAHEVDQSKQRVSESQNKRSSRSNVHGSTGGTVLLITSDGRYKSLSVKGMEHALSVQSPELAVLGDLIKRLEADQYEPTSEIEERVIDRLHALNKVLVASEQTWETLAMKKASLEKLSEDIATTSARREQLRRREEIEAETLEKIRALQLEHEELLLRLGEKEEAIAELHADMDDVQHIYKEQITHLLSQIENA
ncbi:hypothetical protein FVE85_5987 [Porphyridium purpureum]|uniref:TATA element modulatory factor 1 TATA binding domain-containing protein n=1 Tax=Porphyridium purpureum TaxID=35688 RepID=A0A5J4Z5N2_PORPP|nr:hypothetical protein FVE85_5987 [Porphyridium purpureum]|eukprot:POR7024..scf295_1